MNPFCDLCTNHLCAAIAGNPVASRFWAFDGGRAYACSGGWYGNNDAAQSRDFIYSTIDVSSWDVGPQIFPALRLTSWHATKSAIS